MISTSRCSNIAIRNSRGKKRKFLPALSVLFDSFIEPTTNYPRSLTYAQMQAPDPLEVPDIIVLLIEQMDSKIPPLYNLICGSSPEMLSECDTLLNSLVTGNQVRSNYCRGELEKAPSIKICTMLQQFLLRLEMPPFLASEELCDLLYREDFSISLPVGICHHFMSTRKATELKGSLVHSTRAQNATFAYIVERFQRWCQKEIAYSLEKDCHTESTAAQIFEDAVSFLCRTFCNSLIGLDSHYIARERIRDKDSSPLEMKSKVLRLCLGFISMQFWHDISLYGILEPCEKAAIKPVHIKEKHVPGIRLLHDV